VSERSEARTVFGRSNTEIVGQNPTRGMDVSAFLSVVFSFIVRDLASGLSPVQGVLPTARIDSQVSEEF
jgi:hypothetical protein